MSCVHMHHVSKQLALTGAKIGIAGNSASNMPRKYVRTCSRGKWMDLQLQGTLKAVREQEISISAAARKFGIPKTTHFNHCTGKFIYMKELKT